MNLYVYVEDEKLRADYKKYTETRRQTDSGFDLFIPHDQLEIAGHDTTKIGLGIVVAAKNYLSVPAPLLLLPRSSISKTPLRLANSIGLVDAGYRGELCAAVDNISDRHWKGFYGDRLFQICSHDFLPFTKVVIVDKAGDLPAPPDNRGSGGFGSTGSNLSSS